MQNYFNYFTEIEEHFQRRRGSLLMLSTLDWALIETWREAGVPLEAVLRGIDAAFDKYDSRKHHARSKRVNGLAYCTQEVIAAVDRMKEASLGMVPKQTAGLVPPGFEAARIAAHLNMCAEQLHKGLPGEFAHLATEEIAVRLRELAQQAGAAQPNLEELDRTLAVMEDRLFAVLLASSPEADMVAVKEQAARELAPYRSRMKTEQLRQIEQQFVRKRLLEKLRLPRLSLFYMGQS